MSDLNGWDIRASRFALNTANPIRQIVHMMNLTPNPEKDEIKLSLGDPAAFDLSAGHESIEAIIEAVKEGKHNGYESSIGSLDARQAVAEYASTPQAPVTAEDVIMTSGCGHAIELLLTLLVNRGQTLLIPRPYFPLYVCLGGGLEINTKCYDLLPDEEWQVDLESLESSIDETTAAVLFNSPSNPCGSVFSCQHMEKILEICDRHKLPIISDEVYEHMVFKGKEYVSFAQVSQTVPIFAVSSISKRFVLPGWRLGWIVLHNRSGAITSVLKSALVALTTRLLGPSTLIQAALPRILKATPPSLFEHCNQLYEHNAEVMYKLLSAIPGLSPVAPSGAIYMVVRIHMENFPDFKDDMMFIKALMKEESVLCLPTSCFGLPDYFRAVLCMPTHKSAEACQRIGYFCARHFVLTGLQNGQ